MCKRTKENVKMQTLFESLKTRYSINLLSSLHYSALHTVWQRSLLAHWTILFLSRMLILSFHIYIGIQCSMRHKHISHHTVDFYCCLEIGSTLCATTQANIINNHFRCCAISVCVWVKIWKGGWYVMNVKVAYNKTSEIVDNCQVHIANHDENKVNGNHAKWTTTPQLYSVSNMICSAAEDTRRDSKYLKEQWQHALCMCSVSWLIRLIPSLSTANSAQLTKRLYCCRVIRATQQFDLWYHLCVTFNRICELIQS